MHEYYFGCLCTLMSIFLSKNADNRPVPCEKHQEKEELS